MLLLIDAGNTRIKWALVGALVGSLVDSAQPSTLGKWAQSGSLSHQEFSDATPPWRDFVVQRIVVSNVAGDTLRDQLARSFSGLCHSVEWITSQSERAGIKNQYRNPAQLGSDRFAAAIAAHALFPDQALIVATCGTALTIDAVTAGGHFIGGMIAPGLQLMAQSLAQNTAQLPIVTENLLIPAHFADHTEAAMISGCLAAQAGAIEHAAHKFAVAMKADPFCIVSGGAAKYIMPGVNIPHTFVDNLVLIGLEVISC